MSSLVKPRGATGSPVAHTLSPSNPRNRLYPPNQVSGSNGSFGTLHISGAPAQYTVPSPVQPSVLESAAADIANTNGQLLDLLIRARSIADSYFGAGPQNALGSPVPPTPAVSKAESISTATSATFRLVNDLRDQIDRLTCI